MRNTDETHEQTERKWNGGQRENEHEEMGRNRKQKQVEIGRTVNR